MRRRHFLAGGTAGLVLSGLARPQLAAAQGLRVLRFIPQTDLTGLDPHVSSAYITRNHGYMVFDTLYGQNGLYKVSPQMSKGHVIEREGLRWTITLRPNLKFHDGTPVLARDCVASIRRWAVHDSFGQSLMEATDSLSAANDRDIVFALKRPFPRLADALGKSSTYMPAIMPERLALTDPYTEVTEMVGSGPYRFRASERVLGSLTVYEKFDDYVPVPSGIPDWTAGPKVANFDRVEWHSIPQPERAVEALRRGDMDWWDYVTPDQIHPLRRNRDIDVSLQDPSGQIAIMRLNHLHPPFNNPGVRRALLAGVDQKEFMLAVAGKESSMWQTGVGVFCPGTQMDSGVGLEFLTAKPDYHKVRGDLHAAGYKGEPVVVLAATDLPVYKALGEVGAETLQKCGFNVEYHAMDWRSVLERRNSRAPVDQGGWSIFFTAIAGTDILTPAGHLMMRSNGLKAWYGWPTSPRIESLRQQWLEATDQPAQYKIAIAIQQQVMFDVPYIPLGQYLQMTAYRRNLAGVLNGFALFWNVHKFA